MNTENGQLSMVEQAKNKFDQIMVLGAGGVGEVIVTGLTRIPSLKSILIADINLERAEQVVEESNDPRVKAVQLDAIDTEALTKALEHCGIVVHAGIPRFNLNVMDACLKVNCHYIDMAADGPVELPGLVTIQQQLKYDDAFRDKGLLAVLGIGSDPGVTNILSRYAYDHMKQVKEIIVYDGDNSVVKNDQFAIAFSPETSINECLQPPLVYTEGKWNTCVPLETNIEEFVFPDPVGPMTVRSVSHEEVGTIPRFLADKGLEQCDFRYALSEQYVEILKGLHVVGLDREEPVMVGKVKVIPRKVVTSLLPQPADLWESMEGTSCIGVFVKGTDHNDMPLEMFLYTIQSHEFSRQDMGVNVTAFQAGVPAVVAVQMILDGTLNLTGAKCPEQFDPTPWMDRLPKWGMPLYVRKTITEKF